MRTRYTYDAEHGTHEDHLDICWHCCARFLPGAGTDDGAYCSRECQAEEAELVQAAAALRRERR